MGKNHLRQSLIPKTASQQSATFKYINTNPTIMHGWTQSDDSANVMVSIRFCQWDTQCFSDWNKHDMKSFWGFIEKVHNYTWQQVYQTASKGQGKSGFAYTIMPIETYPETDFRNTLDPGLTLFELRVDKGKRVHGFRDKSIFYIIWLDKDHEYGN